MEETTVEEMLATTELSVDDVIRSFKARAEQMQHDLTVRDALILKLQRELQEAHHVVDQLRSASTANGGEPDEH